MKRQKTEDWRKKIAMSGSVALHFLVLQRSGFLSGSAAVFGLFPNNQ